MRYGTGNAFNPALTAQAKDPHAPAFKISYEKQDSAIREEYYRELAKSGDELRLKPLDQGGD